MKTSSALLTGVALLAACDSPRSATRRHSDRDRAGQRETIVSSRVLVRHGYRLGGPDPHLPAERVCRHRRRRRDRGGRTSSDPAVLFGALIGALHTFDATDWTARASRMADEIKRQGPDVISLNEISTIARRGLGDYGVADNTTDFLPIFLARWPRVGSTIGWWAR